MSTNTDPCSYLDAVGAIARDAGRRILEIYEGDFAVSHKGDGSPVTAADQAAQEVIVAALARLTPEVPILSEESAQAAHAERAQWRRFWLVDPLDGTKEFVSRNGEFTVNIALIERDTPILGVVHVPVTDITYAACRGDRAYKRSGAARAVPIAARSYDGSRAPRVVASRSHAKRPDVEFLARLGAHELVSMGSSLKFCLVAEGAADVYPRLGTTMEWDTAAAQCIVEAAGGKVVGPDAEPLRYNKPSLQNPWLLASGAGPYDWMRYIPRHLLPEEEQK
jgi:3'(2'), 5'-bisphosphate nucleotidase